MYKILKWLKDFIWIEKEKPCIDEVTKMLHSILPKTDLNLSIKRIVLKDGTTLSIEASDTNYPPLSDKPGPYYDLEVEHQFIDHSNSDKISYTNCVYVYVPIELVVGFIRKHGGIEKQRRKYG